MKYWIIIVMSWFSQAALVGQVHTTATPGSVFVRAGASSGQLLWTPLVLSGRGVVTVGRQLGYRWQYGLEMTGDFRLAQHNQGWIARTNPLWWGGNLRGYLRKIDAQGQRLHPFVELGAGMMLWSGTIWRNVTGQPIPNFPRRWGATAYGRAGCSYWLAPYMSLELQGTYWPYGRREENRVVYLRPHTWALALAGTFHFPGR